MAPIFLVPGQPSWSILKFLQIVTKKPAYIYSYPYDDNQLLNALKQNYLTINDFRILFITTRLVTETCIYMKWKHIRWVLWNWRVWFRYKYIILMLLTDKWWMKNFAKLNLVAFGLCRAFLFRWLNKLYKFKCSLLNSLQYYPRWLSSFYL